MDTQSLIFFYLIKRTFLFFDEHLFYLFLYLLYYKKYYKLLPAIIIYGISCLYTSYSNLDKIEEQIIPIDQKIFLFNYQNLQNFFGKIIS